ncbi:class I SAM-dependent methyltransferase [Streptomyces silvensis]|uniref:Methyltransferase domain-containing protein n=1 Tax=Streptomyces silvensis TaxID=1765722 RepID=A0A0W7XAV4_9ACTN|nr:class I SAM-dependent methyltransferase [Streptomyces silvensis]KUF20134.1 hypothetical protein AT728_40110 [Streptomyces silvensis]
MSAPDHTGALTAGDWDAYYTKWGGRLVTQVEKERFLRLAPSPRGRRVADIGCGNGAWTRQLALWGARVTGYDYSAVALRQARCHPQPGMAYEQWDVTSGPAPDSLAAGSVDLVTCRLSLAYLDIEPFLGHVADWLTSDGALYILTPVQYGPLRPRPPAADDDPYLRAITEDQLTRLLASSPQQWDSLRHVVVKQFSVLVLQGPTI